MSKFIFLIDQDNHTETIYNAIPADTIKTLRVTETYDHYGQEVSPENAGAYVSLNSLRAVEIANKAYHDEYAEMDNDVIESRYGINDIVNAYDCSCVYDAVVSECTEGEDYTICVETCKGFNYWDGSNWKSVIIEYEFDNTDTGWKVLEDEKLQNELNEAIENMKYVYEGYGATRWETEKYIITKSQFASNWATYQIMPK